ncbi:ParB/RepB/Spo0J family partition protein [Phaeobacter gallaeciensis]|uniref:Plasmid partitioning protein ParB n=1 Tax=Phaeobacter gallaeciensis TaxID=60890 RepID=A0AAC9ZEX5_9RHOB|nr:ParB N-terminal domain-containing protein [Phaeobacter gallaeciensis]AHD11927.1 plasmid partitioning protein ParB [Phaeobacter gallaeciensis DSM 26640]ATE95193.1 plasmid partitioning protein ParB [Phaeobacter gallaeciensis]ATE99584.1 plasmid partitioning protein ParB [Phaeobacter gallaeciensis]ATF03898.1 plasmid partitioning protein ParB [Phaeobacter gallaeciensis]ATF08174.1 plasmid partitioning protein ParB [Phaeobacter gallaeciensis]
MAKRRRLSAPDASEIEAIEEGFATKPGINPFDPAPGGVAASAPPIAKVSAEAAQLHGMASVADRVEMARDKADAERWRAAEEAGETVLRIPLAEIDRDYLRRDRMQMDEEELDELTASIRSHGLRSPVEVIALEEGYGLVSGFRRLEAYARLNRSEDGFAAIPAFLRRGADSADAYVAMIEENELRANLTPYERGRIAVLVAGQGVFPSVELAVDALFGAASKAKRSKVRSFAAVHEGLGDLLRYPNALSEKAGLKLAAALRSGGQGTLRSALAGADPVDERAEWRLLEAVLADAGPTPEAKPRGGRPRQVTRLAARRLSSGGDLSAEVAPTTVRIDLKGRSLDPEQVEALLALIEDRLG